MKRSWVPWRILCALANPKEIQLLLLAVPSSAVDWTLYFCCTIQEAGILDQIFKVFRLNHRIVLPHCHQPSFLEQTKEFIIGQPEKISKTVGVFFIRQNSIPTRMHLSNWSKECQERIEEGHHNLLLIGVPRRLVDMTQSLECNNSWWKEILVSTNLLSPANIK